jgi:hypothetical protein
MERFASYGNPLTTAVAGRWCSTVCTSGNR